MFVHENDVYVVGEVTENNILNRRNEWGEIITFARAEVWVNGVSSPRRLQGTFLTASQAMRGGGTTHGGLVGVEQREPNTLGSSVFVSGNDVFVTGVFQPGGNHARAMFWVNREIQRLPTPIPYTVTITGRSRANSVYVSGEDVFVVGNVEFRRRMVQTNRAILWTNGEPQILSTASSRANSVVVSDGNVYVVGAVRQN